MSVNHWQGAGPCGKGHTTSQEGGSHLAESNDLEKGTAVGCNNQRRWRLEHGAGHSQHLLNIFEWGIYHGIKEKERRRQALSERVPWTPAWGNYGWLSIASSSEFILREADSLDFYVKLLIFRCWANTGEAKQNLSVSLQCTISGILPA